MTTPRTLLPDLVNFAYIPRNDLRVHADASSGNRRERSPDFSEFATKAAAGGSHAEEDEHVLVLDFNSSSKGKKASGSVTAYIRHSRSQLTNCPLLPDSRTRFRHRSLQLR
jgi:DEAD/DEAH box helicase domain-containing protein